MNLSEFDPTQKKLLLKGLRFAQFYLRGDKQAAEKELQEVVDMIDTGLTKNIEVLEAEIEGKPLETELDKFITIEG